MRNSRSTTPQPAPKARAGVLPDLSLQIEMLPPARLVPDPRNPRQHKKRQLHRLTESIRTFGFVVPILIDGDAHVIAGHGRLIAAEMLGIGTIPCIRLEHLDADQVRALKIADNRLTELSSWHEEWLAGQLKELSELDLDFDIEATGFSVGEIDFRIEALEGRTAASDPADVPVKLQHTAVSRIGDSWRLGEHRVLCGDAQLGSSYGGLTQGAEAAMVFSDPPYNVEIDGFVGGKGRVRHREFAMAAGEMTPDQFENFLSTVFGHMANNSTNGSLHYLCMDWRHAREIILAGNRQYDELKNLCVWVKDRAGMGSLYRSQHELVFVFKSGKGRHRNNVELGRNGRHRSNVWEYPAIVSQRKGEEGDLLALHPTVKPIRLISDAILDATARGDMVLDAFLGSGSTLMACQRVGRICYGMELDPFYVDTAIRRWQRDTGQMAILESTGETFDKREQAVLKSGRAADAMRMSTGRKLKQGGRHG
jgi:DNA modification methylase